MKDHEKRATQRVPVALRIRLRYHAVDQFISKFAVNISRGGMFLSSRNPKLPGTELYFEIRLADESPVIEGSGEVRWIREYDRNRPDEPHGMGIQFLELSEASWPMLDRIIAHRRTIGENDDHSIPSPRFSALGLGGDPAQGNAARPRAGTAGSGPGNSAEHGRPGTGTGEHARPGTGTGEHRAARPTGTSEHGPHRDGGGPDERLRGELLRALSPSVPLSRPEDASRALASDRGADPPVVRAAVARARALSEGVGAGDGLDRELAALLDENAGPLEVSVEAASRELAERLGGAPVARRAVTTPPAPRRAPRSPATVPPAHARAVEPAAQAPPHRPMTLDDALEEDPETPLPAAAPERESDDGAKRALLHGILRTKS